MKPILNLKILECNENAKLKLLLRIIIHPTQPIVEIKILRDQS